MINPNDVLRMQALSRQRMFTQGTIRRNGAVVAYSPCRIVRDSGDRRLPGAPEGEAIPAWQIVFPFGTVVAVADQVETTAGTFGVTEILTGIQTLGVEVACRAYLLFDAAGTPVFLRPNASVWTARRDGTTVYPPTAPRRVRIDDEAVDDDPGMVEIRADASTALAPILRKVLHDVAAADYQRGDIVQVLALDNQPVLPQGTTFHVLRALRPAFSLPATDVALARLDIQMQRAVYRQRITETTPGAATSADWDPVRDLLADRTDGSYGVGFTAPEHGTTRQGYRAPVVIHLAVNEYASVTVYEDAGRTEYESPVVIYEPQILPDGTALTLAKGDLLVVKEPSAPVGNAQPAERRFIVADVLHQLQRMGVLLATLCRVEYRDPRVDPLTYSIPLA